MLGSLFSFLGAEENYVILKIEGPDSAASGILQLRAGEIAETVKVHNFSFDSLTYQVVYGENSIIRPQGETVYGPSKIQVIGNKLNGSGFAYIVIKVLGASSETKNVLGTVRLPESSDQKIELFLEESQDLKIWKPVQPGIFNGNPESTYYRANMKVLKGKSAEKL